MNLRIALLLCLLITTASADSLRLKNLRTSEVLGPYEEGDILALGTNRFVVMLQPPVASVASMLNSITLSQVNFRQADLQDVVAFLREATIAQDPQQVGVNFIIKPLQARPSSEGAGLTQPAYPRVTLNLRKVSLKNVLLSLQAATGYTIRIQHNAVVIGPPEPF
jgi:hypothetical protein